jgi:hypothetical protein
LTNTTQKEFKGTAFSEEDVCVISKRDPCAIWAGTKFMYSGVWDATPQQASGYNFGSGESDVEPINNLSGWGEIRIPELNQLHKLFVFPKNPRIIARVDYQTLTVGTGSGQPNGEGGCSGKVARVHWMHICSGCQQVSGEFEFNSGLVDVIAFGSEY